MSSSAVLAAFRRARRRPFHPTGCAGRRRPSSSRLARCWWRWSVFGAFMALIGKDPLEVYALIYKGAFSSGFAWQNTLQRAAPLILTALCVALPAQAGLIVIGGEGALVLGGLGSRRHWPCVVGRLAAGRQDRHGAGGHDRRRRVDRAGRVRCATTAASTKPSAACCSLTSRSPCSITSSKARCATRPA